MGGIHVAEALDVPFYSAFTMPWTRTRYYAHPFGTPDRYMGETYNYLSHASIEQVLWKGITAQVNRWRKQDLKLVIFIFLL